MEPARLLCPWDFPGKNTEVGCHFLLQGIFSTQGSIPHLLHWQADSLLPSHQVWFWFASNSNILYSKSQTWHHLYPLLLTPFFLECMISKVKRTQKRYWRYQEQTLLFVASLSRLWGVIMSPFMKDLWKAIRARGQYFIILTKTSVLSSDTGGSQESNLHFQAFLL